MRRSTSVLRTFVTAIALLLSALLAADSAAAQVVPVTEHGVVSAEGAQVSSEDSPHTVPADCKSHRGARNPVNTPAPAVNPLHMCVCHSGPDLGPKYVVPVTGSEAFPRGRSVDLSVLHQVFRC